jgi:hypothetical protein
LLLLTADGGASWTDGTPRDISNGTNIEEVYFWDLRHGWVTVRDSKKEVIYMLLTTNGGKSWTRAAIPFFNTDGLGLHFFNPDHGVAGEVDAGLGNAYYRFFETHDGGKNWKPVMIVPPDPEMSRPGEIHLCNLCGDTINYDPPANVIIAHGDMGDEEPKDAVRLSISTNLGKSWHNLNLPLPSEKYRERLIECDTPVFVDDKHGWLPVHLIKENADGTNADGTVGTVTWNEMAFYTTDDSGETWTPRPGIIDGGTNGIGSLDIVSAKNIYVNSGANLSVTHDGAQSWQTIKPNIDFDRTNSNGDISDGISWQIDFVDVKHGWAVISETFNKARAFSI